MGTARNSVECGRCGCEFDIVLEWTGKAKAIEKIQLTKCPECGSDDWFFTDEMGM